MFIVYLVVFGGVACLFPLAFYCLLLASWNGRRRPMFAGGPADFAGVVLATSGFLIAGGPLILFGMHEYSLREGEYPKFVSAWSALASPSWLWLSAWAGYFLVVVGGLTWLLIRRRPISVIYNIDEGDAEELLPSTLNRMGLAWAARGRQYWIETPRPDGLRRTMVEVTIAPILRNLTLRWLATPGEIRWEI
ncbi:MAG TPA: hypothetical protein VH120_01155, partial [Gemmataceae bacterium]|nr:hypothetical protein [Gemmataceae bacterium]